MAAITLDIGGNTRQLDRDIQKTVNKVYSINLRTKGDQPLGRITGKVNEFTKSLDASNARVIAFGASAGIIYGLERAFTALVSSTIEVQKSLQDINVILNVSSSELQKFGSELFSIARNTGQSFQEVAKAATEFSRQGLGIEETLKRTNQALILSRLSGLDAAKSVEALTAAVNSFASQAVTATEVVNKFATVDAAFAVSSADLADAISRVGSSAAQSGVSLNELIAIVTSAQQTTARGGAVIGNSFKTIFTRLQREKVVDLLESLGISGTDASGQVKSTIQLLTDLGKVYDTLGAQQQAYVAEQVGGVFQINILKAALADLGKEYSIYSSALNVSAGATDEAIRRNEELNKSYASQINALQENARQIAASAGERLLGPTIDRLVGGSNSILEMFNESDGQGVGKVLGQGILDGLGQFISGPGIALIGGVLLKLFRDLGKFATGSVKELLGLNTAASQQRDLQASIQQILAKNPQLLDLALKGEQGLNTAANQLLSNLRLQTVELQKQAQVAAQISKAFIAQAGVRVSGGVPIAPTKVGKAAGYIPNFAAKVSPQNALGEMMGALEGGYMPGKIQKVQGKTINGAESVYKWPGVREYEIRPPEDSPAGKEHMKGMNQAIQKAYGVIPNFAVPSVRPYIDYANSLGLAAGKTNSPAYKEVVRLVNKTSGGKPRSEEEIKNDIKNLAGARKGTVGAANALKGAGKFAYMYASQGEPGTYKGRVALTKGAKPVPFNFSTVGLKRPYTFEDDINKDITPVLTKLAAKIVPPNKLIKVQNSDFNQFIDKSAFNQLYGRLFEAVINRAIGKVVKGESGTQRFEFFKGDLSTYQKTLNDIFKTSSGVTDFEAGDLKFRPPSPQSGSVLSFVKKMAAQSGVPYDKSATITAAQGYIPNFAALQEAISRERAAGVPSSKIYVAQDKRLAAGGYNPLGLGVFNTRDEPTTGARSQAIKSRGYASGYIPNFAIESSASAETTDVLGALTVQLSTVLPMLALTAQRGNEYAQSVAQITEANKNAGKVTGQWTAEQRKSTQELVRSGKITTEEALKRVDAARFGATGVQKLGARLGGGENAAFAISMLAPIIAQTVKQGIDQSSKEGRVKGAVTSGVGNVASFAATGFAVGGPWGALAGGILGAGMSIKDVLDELNTDFPELAAAAQKAQEKLTQFGDQSNRITQVVEQIKQVRESGNVQKAGELQAELLRTVSAEFADRPELGARIITSITNNDFESLTTALNENTAALVEDSKLKTEEAFRVKNIETLRDEGVGSKKGKEAITSLGKQLMLDVSKGGLDLTKGGISTTEVDTVLQDLTKIGSNLENEKIANAMAIAAGPGQGTFGAQQMQATAKKEITKGDYLSYIKDSGLPEAVRNVVFEFIESGGTIEGAKAILEEYKKNIDNANNVAIQVANQTGIGNKALEAVNKALGRISENFNKLAILSDEAIALETAFKNERKQAVDAYNISVSEESAQTAVSFGAKSQQKEFAAEAGLGKIQSDFDKSMGDSLQSVTTLIGQAFNKSFTQQFSNIGSFDSQNKNPDTRGRNQLAEAQRLAQNLIPDNIISMVEGIIKPENFGTEGFNVAEIVTALEENTDFQKLGEDERNAAIQKVEEELKKSNQTLQSSKILLEQQKAILANQKLNEIMREFADAIQNAFGGVSKFLEGKYGDKTMTDNMFDILGERRSYREAAGRDGVMDRQTSTEMGRTAGQYTDLLEGMIGRKGVFGTNDKLVQEEITGYANNIEGIFNQAIKDAQASGDIAAIEGLDKTRIELIRQSGLDATPEDFTGSMRDVFEAISRMAVTQRRETGQIEEGLKTAAIEQLAKSGPMGEQLAELAKKGVGGISTESIFINQGTEQISLLERILEAIQQGQDESTKASLEAETSLDRNPFAGGPVDASLSTFMDQPLPSISLDDENISLDLGATQSLAPSSFLTPSLEDPSTLNPTTSLFPTVRTPIPPPETPLIPTVPAPALDLNTPTSLMPSTPLINAPEQGFTLGGAASETPLPLMANDLFAGANIQIPAEAITVAPSNTSSPAGTTPNAPGTQPVFSKAQLDTLKDFFAGFSQMRSQYNSPTVPIPIAPKSVNITPVSPNEGTTAPTSPTASVNVPVSVNINATTAQSQTTEVSWEQLGPEIQSLVDSNMPALLSKIGAQTQRNEQVLNNILSNPQFASFRPAPSQTSSQGIMPP